MDSKGQDILFNSEMKQKDLMIQMLSERLDEKDETITELKETINEIQLPVSGKHWMNSSGNSLVQAVRRQNRIRKRKKL